MQNKLVILKSSSPAKGEQSTQASNSGDNFSTEVTKFAEAVDGKRWRIILLAVSCVHLMALILARNLIVPTPSPRRTQPISISLVPTLPHRLQKTLKVEPSTALNKLPIPRRSTKLSRNEPSVRVKRTVQPHSLTETTTMSAHTSSPLGAPVLVQREAATSTQEFLPVANTVEGPKVALDNSDKKPRMQNDIEKSELSAGADVGAWHEQLQERLHRFKRYPPESIELQQQGTVWIRFRINRNGKVLIVKIEKSSGSELLDEEAMSLLKRIQPLPKPPSGIAEEQLELVVPIDFSLN